MLQTVEQPDSNWGLLHCSQVHYSGARLQESHFVSFNITYIYRINKFQANEQPKHLNLLKTFEIGVQQFPYFLRTPFKKYK